MSSEDLAGLIVRELGRHRSAEEVTRMLCEQHGMNWGEAEQCVRRVAQERGRSIAGRQTPLTLVLIVAGMLAGLGLIARWLLVYLAVGGQAFLSIGLLGQAGVGLLMIIGSIYGIFDLVRSLTR